MTEVRVRLGELGLDRGAHLLLHRALAPLPRGARVLVYGRDPALRVHLPAWCRREGHALEWFDRPSERESDPPVAAVIRGHRLDSRWAGAVRAGEAQPGAIVARPAARWGLAPR